MATDMSIKKRNEKLKEVTTDFIWMVMRKFHNSLLDRCSLCLEGQRLKEKEICKSKCKDYGFKGPISLNSSIEKIVDVLERRI